MQIKGELKDERDERFHASSLKTMANAVDDGSNHDYDNDIHNGRHQIKRDGQPRDDARRHSRFANDKKEDAREIIRRAQERERTKKQDKEEDRDKEHDDNRRRNEKRKYDTPYERGGAAPATTTANKNGDARRTTRLTAVSTRRLRPTRTRTTPTES